MNETASAVLDEVGGASAPPLAVSGISTVGDWITLLKPRVLTLVVFTGWIGLLVAPGHLHPVLGFTAVLAITVAGVEGLKARLTGVASAEAGEAA